MALGIKTSHPAYFLACMLAQVAGFIILASASFLGLPYFIIGAAIFLLGSALSLFIADIEQLRTLGRLSVAALLINTVWYTSEKVISLGDASLLIYFLLLGNLALLAWLAKNKALPFNFNVPFLALVGFFLTAILLSLIYAAHAKEVVYFFLINLAGLLVFYTSQFLQLFAGKAKAVVKILVGLGVISALLAVWQLYSGSFKYLYYPFIAARDQIILENWELVSRVVGTWQHPSYLGMFLAICLPLAVYLLFYESRKSWLLRIYYSGAIILLSATLLLTNTRSSVIAGFLGIVLMFFLAEVSFGKKARLYPDVKKIAVLGLLASAALLLYQFAFVQQIYSKPQAWRVDASAAIWGRFIRADSMSTESLVQRSQLYDLARQVYLRSPVVGIGAKNFQFEVEKKFGQATDGHNLILQTAAEMGTVGILATVMLYGAVIFALFKFLVRVPRGPERVLQATLLSVTLLVFFDSFFNNPLYSVRLLVVLWLIVSLQQINIHGQIDSQN